MSDVLKTNELIEKLALAAEDAAGGPPSAEQVDALIDYSDALREALERSQRGGATLGEIIKQQCEDIVKITRSEDLILPDGDGDYETVWERAFKMRADLDALEARQPSEDDRESLIDVVKRNRSVVKRMSDGYPSVAFVTDETIADAILAAGFSRAAVPDAATEELANAKDGWDSALRIVNESNDISKKLGAERDAALAAIDRARAVCLHLGGVDGDVSQPAPSYYVSVGRNAVATEVLAALDGAPEPEVKP